MDDAHAFGVSGVHIHEFRSVRVASFTPGPLTALVGDANTGKSNILAALRWALDPGVQLAHTDIPSDRRGLTAVHVDFVDGSTIHATDEGGAPEGISVVYLPAELRSNALLDMPDPAAEGATRLIAEESTALNRNTDDAVPRGSTIPAHGLVRAFERCLAEGFTDTIFLVEEPELFLPPQTQRFLYRVLRDLTDHGNQVFYSTHSPSFLNVGRLDELLLLDRAAAGTRLTQPKRLDPEEEFVAYSEFDAARSELFLARVAILVEGLTEKLALPFVFRALGTDPDRERISIIECGGKANIVLAAHISKASGIPFLILHDRDAAPGERPNESESRLNAAIGRIAGKRNRFEMAPDFEGVAGFRGRRHKPEHAWRRVQQLQANEVPDVLRAVVERSLRLARGD